MQQAKPNFNSFYGELQLIAENYKLKTSVDGWWDTFRNMDMDIQATLEPGQIVTVWFSGKQKTYIICQVKKMDQAFHKNVDTLFTAYFKNI